MSGYLGDYGVDDTVNVYFSTNAADGGRESPSDTFEVADFRIYKDGVATKRASEAGYTYDNEVDGMTGLHCLSIDLSDNTDDGFYASGSEYVVVLYPDETVDSQSIAAVLAQFSIERNNGALARLKAVPPVDTTKILGTALTETAGGYLAGSFKKFFDIQTPAGTVNLIAANATQFAGQTITCGAGVTIGAYVGNATHAIVVDANGYVTYANAAPPTAAAIATAVWQDTTAGDFSTAHSIGNALFIDAVPGGTGGHFIAGTNAATSITTALTANITGNITGNLVGTVSTLTTYTGNTPQTGDAYPGVATAAAYAIVNSGMGFRGTVSAADPGVSFTIGTLAGLGAGAFIDTTAPWYAYVFRDNGGLAEAPQGQIRKVTGYTTATGLFTTDAFTEAVAVGDDVIIINPRLADIASIRTKTDYLPSATAGEAGGVFIAGTNAATTITTSLTTGAIALTTPISADVKYVDGASINLATGGRAAANLKTFLDVATMNLTGACFNITGYTLAVDAAHKVAVPDTQKVDLNTIKTQDVTCGAGVTVLASVGTADTSTAQTADSNVVLAKLATMIEEAP